MSEVDSSDDYELPALLRLLDAEQTRADVLMNVVIPIGVAMAYESDWDRLLDRIISDARKLCRADGGSIFLVDGTKLKPVLVKVDSLGVSLSEHARQGELAYGLGTALLAVERGESVNLSDMESAERACAGIEMFDRAHQYRTESCLAVPLRGKEGHVIGAVCLMNARRPFDQQVCAFEMGTQQVIESLCLLAAAALESYVRQQELKNHVRDLKIQIDESHKGKQVSAIVQSEYFKTLQGRARALREALSQE